MRRYTTPTHVWTFEENPSNYTAIVVSYAQNGAVILQKTKNDMTFSQETIEGKTVWLGSYRLSQEETAKFRAGVVASVQARAIDTDGGAPATSEAFLAVEDVLDKRVMS